MSTFVDENSPLISNGEPPNACAHGLQEACAPNPYAAYPVYETIHRVRLEVMKSIEDPYTLEQLRSPRINVDVVRPLVDRLWDHSDISIIYCLLVNKLQFLREQGFKAHTTMNMTRALLCEIVATRILRRFDEENAGSEGLLLITNAMVGSFWPFQNAPQSVMKQSGYAAEWASTGSASYQRTSTALEIAIISESKMLIGSPACQMIMEAIHTGQVIYTPVSFIDILPDHYKHNPIALYRPDKAPLLNQYRLMVPRTRNVIDVCQFLVLLVLYILLMQNKDYTRFTIYEAIFCVYALGWVLDEFASMVAHGWHCYTQNLWSFLDSIFSLIFLVYFVIRLHSLATGNNLQSATAALDLLSAAAPVLIPRLAFNLMSENMLFVSLRAMMADFTILTFLAVWCFAGFLLSLGWLSGDMQDGFTISKWMIFVWFGLDGTGIEESATFHWLIGPTLMILFAILGNTLFLTILVSMLTSTFAKIASNATAEIQFRRAVVTFEGVKRDSIFAYLPPFNLLAISFILPLKLVVSPRWFHKVNVAVIRAINFPLLIAISIFERHSLWAENHGQNPLLHQIARRRKMVSDQSSWLSPIVRLWDLSRFSVHGDTQAVFEFDAPDGVLNQITEELDASGPIPEEHGSQNVTDVLSSAHIVLRGSLMGSSRMKLKRRRTTALDASVHGTEKFGISQYSRKRRDSVDGLAGGPEVSADISQDIDRDYDDSIDIRSTLEALRNRLEEVEGANQRMEKLLQRIADSITVADDRQCSEGDAVTGGHGA